jgi:hypothetical protein
VIFLKLLWLFWTLLLDTDDDDTDNDDDTDDDNDDDTDDGDQDQDKDDKRVRDAKLQELSSEAKKWRLKFREVEKEIKELRESHAKAAAEELKKARLETAFYRSVLVSGQTIDVETAFDLLTIKGFADSVKIPDDGAGEVEGMDQALETLVLRYPWLEGTDDGSDDTDQDGDAPPLRRTASPPKKKPANANVQSYDRSELERRMPTLVKHRG